MEKEEGGSLAIGIAMGLMFGLLFDNLALGLAIGVALGASGRSLLKIKKDNQYYDHY
ncbi:hypothetical protein ABW365_02845 [Enterococcus avium]